ncbi:hypothetical protein JCM17961_35520 [Endothiovibrio diazotrophicus]
MEDNAVLIRGYLEGTPHRLDVVADGEAAVARYRAGSYDLVLMDVRMPKLDGLAAVREIRRWEAEEGRLSRPILALTAHATTEDVDRALEAGCNAHLAKPLKRSVFLAALADFTADD